MLDDATPRDVWAEYEQRKRALSPALTPDQYQLELARIADELGVGVAFDDLTADQLGAQAACIARHTTRGTGCKP